MIDNLDKDDLDNRSNSDIDLTYLFNFFKRKKKDILIFTSLSSIIGGLFAFQLKPIYVGDFSIMNNANEELLAVFANELRNKYNFQNKPKGILQFRAKQKIILQPVFDKYLKNQKNQELDFDSWSKNLTLKYDDDTNIISVSFQDENKKLLLETLNNLKKEYEKLLSNNQETLLKNTKKIIRSLYLIQKLDKEILINKELKLGFSKMLEKELLNSNLNNYNYLASQIITELNKNSRDLEEYKNILDRILIMGNQSPSSITISEIDIRNEIYKISKFRLLINTTLFSFLLIVILLISIEKISKKIYDFEILNAIINTNYLGDLYFFDQKNSKEFLKKILSKINKNCNLGLLRADSISQESSKIFKFLNELDNNLKQIDLSNLSNIDNFDKIVVVASNRTSTFKDLELLNNFMYINKEKINGWVFIK